jgi:hypothetical protein
MRPKPIQTRKSRLQDQGNERDLRDTTPEQRIGMMWQLALDAWSISGADVDAPMARHMVRIVRGKPRADDG